MKAGKVNATNILYTDRMSMRHELPSPRRRSSSQYLDRALISPARPLSASFFAAIDPLTSKRISTLSLYPQHIFPSESNKLDSSLEIPYAFSHEKAAFYWTRDDALANYKLNIWAKPPCVSCELVGEDFARSCNRYTRQEDSLGKIKCCTRCERLGQATSCIEQIEIRGDGTYGHIDVEKGETSKSSQWSTAQRDLREGGIVWWAPINLDYGDNEQKEVIFARWKEQRHPRLALPTSGIDKGTQSYASFVIEQISRAQGEEKMLVGRARNQELVAEWDEEDLTLEPRLLALQAEEAATAATVATTKEATRLNESSEKSPNSKLEDDQLYWVGRIRAETEERYFKEVEEVGREVAGALQTAEEALIRNCVSQARRFLQLKHSLMESGASEEEAVLSSKQALSEDVDSHLQGLVPQMFETNV